MVGFFLQVKDPGEQKANSPEEIPLLVLEDFDFGCQPEVFAKYLNYGMHSMTEE